MWLGNACIDSTALNLHFIVRFIICVHEERFNMFAEAIFLSGKQSTYVGAINILIAIQLSSQDIYAIVILMVT